jgi:hypothetical protein
VLRYDFPILVGWGRTQTFLDEGSPNLSVVSRGNSDPVASDVPNKLFWGVEEYRLDLMRLPLLTFRSVVATGVSLWMGVLACLVGCTVPILASSGASSAPLMHENSAEPNQPGVMADLPNCPHHFGGNAPAEPNEPKPVRGGGMSCCPVEVTVASKPEAVALRIAPASDFVLASDFNLARIRIFHPAEFVPRVWHSGRDTLLETQLLRI